MSFLTKIFGTRNDKIIKSLQPNLQKINALEPAMKGMSDEELKAQTPKLKEKLAKGATLNDILPEAFATCREASVRSLKMRHFDVQMLGGMILHKGNIAEMRTGEGKTLTATLPTYLNALAGKGAHVVTVNDYLAKRDSEWMGQLYGFLGLNTGVILHGLNDRQRQAAYHMDITYGTNNEFGFDFLRDNMKTDPNSLVQREFNFAIVDEVDSILIDEARTPLIISGPSHGNLELYSKVSSVIPGIKKDVDYTMDEKSRTVSLTEDGISKMEKRLGIANLFDPKNIDWLHHIQQALKAYVLFKKDVDYVVRNGEIIIVDEFTGRLMPGRRYSDGLHGALEAKEHVKVQQETQTLATITFQNYFRLYKTLSGMTGTADTEAVEFKKIYNLDVVVVPTNRKMIRLDEEDVVYRTAREKFTAIAKEIAEAQKKGQPVLVGTASVEKSELVSSMLTSMNIPHDVLNAKNHAREAQIIENAGQAGHVTIATNMAGRGTDIALGAGVIDVGGLYVIGTERHESRRIDNQLRGRSGRQGDPGKTKFFLSLEDDLMRIFASDRLSAVMARLGMEEGESIVSPMVTRAIEKAQKRVEEQNFSSRKNVLEYDDVMNQQRQVIYKRRRAALLSSAQIDFFDPVIHENCLILAEKFSPENISAETWDFESIYEEVKKLYHVPVDMFKLKQMDGHSNDIIADYFLSELKEHYRLKMQSVPEEVRMKLENYVYLQVLDLAWKDHLLAMDALKDSVSLRGYGQRDPLQEYKKEAFTLFNLLVNKIENETTEALLHLPPPTMTMVKEAEEEHSQDLELDEDELIYKHEEASSVITRQQQEKKAEKLIYPENFEAREAREEREVVQTFKREADKVGRNDACPCGSGKKYKKCHGA